MTPEQCRAARGVLGWEAKQLVELSGLGNRQVLWNFETRKVKAQPKTVSRLKATFEAHGITFGKDGHSISWELPEG